MEQRQALGTRLVAATTVVVVFLALAAVMQPAGAAISAITPGSATVTAGESANFTVSLTTPESCVNVTGTGGSITATISPRCGSGDGPWTAIVTLSVDITAQARTYPLRVHESPPIGSSAGADTIELPLTVVAAETTTTTIPAPTTTTVPGPPPPEPPATEPPETEPPVTEPPADDPTPPPTEPSITTTTTIAEPPSPPTTVRPPDDTSTTTTDVSPTSTSTIAERETILAAAPPPPSTTTTLPAVSQGDIAVALPATVAGADIDEPESRSFGDIAQALPRSLRDLVVSPFLIIKVILRAIQDTGAVSIWAMLLALPVLVDWRRMRRKLSHGEAMTTP